MTKLVPLVAGLLLSGMSIAQAQDGASSCGDSVEVRRGDTISSIAERCNVPEGRLLAANPTLDSSGDLVIGHSISTRSAARRAGERLWGDVEGAVDHTSEALEGVASGLNATAQDILDKNPDLRSRVEQLGARFGVTAGGSMHDATLEAKPVSRHASIDVTAEGLPANASVHMNVGPVGAASEQVAQMRTSTDGTVRETVPLPDWLPAGKQVVITLVDGDGNVLVRSSVPDAN